jgi:hypothetical protein
MEPGVYRGDILFLHLSQRAPFHSGDIVVFSLDGRDIPIVHRIIKVGMLSNAMGSESKRSAHAAALCVLHASRFMTVP